MIIINDTISNSNNNNSTHSHKIQRLNCVTNTGSIQFKHISFYRIAVSYTHLCYMSDTVGETHSPEFARNELWTIVRDNDGRKPEMLKYIALKC